MPIYEYECKRCGETFESLVLGGREPEKCPGCKSADIKKMMSSCKIFAKSGIEKDEGDYAPSASCGASSFS